MNTIKVAVGLSGGVDSAVAAARLVDEGHQVTGVHITCWSGPGCRSEEDRQDALDLALQLSIPFVHLDFQKEYKDKVYEYMMAEYQAGRTPNPDVMCNREIKFGLFYEWALKEGFNRVATGHYAQTDGKDLLRSRDDHKDQTYFLYQLKQEQLAHILFPIGAMTKSEVRTEAKKRKLVTANKPDSQGICFIGEQPMEAFLKTRIKAKPGEIYLNGKVVGKHKGVQFYTIGQKIGLDNAKIEGFDSTQLPHFYVMKKDLKNNLLEVGVKDQLYTCDVELGECHWISESPQGENLQVKIRHGGELISIKDFKKELEGCTLGLDKPVWGVASGQSAVIYQNKKVLGGGVIRG